MSSKKLPNEWWEVRADWYESVPNKSGDLVDDITIIPVYDKAEAQKRYRDAVKGKPDYACLTRCSFVDDPEVIEEYGEERSDAENGAG